MRKRILSLLIVLALCLGLLPVTALAADGIELYVGGQQIKESGCYENKMELGQRLTVQNLPAVSFIMTQTPSPLR